MTDEEFEILDQLYFVVSFDQLKSELDFQEDQLLNELTGLYHKGWIKILKTVDDEVSAVPDPTTLKQCFFLATKKGLQAHNS